MLSRVFAVAMNTYREAVRARVLLALLAVALAASAYSLVVATMSLNQGTRVVADLGATTISASAVAVSIVLGATSLYRELELKTVFPILTRRLRRHEYLLGKYFGILATILAFVAIDGGFLLAVLGVQSRNGEDAMAALAPRVVVAILALAVPLLRLKGLRTFVVLPWSIGFFVLMAFFASTAGPDRQLLIASTLLTLAEIAIVGAVATLFSSFSSPFLTAIFTLMLFLIGRSADTLGNLPVHVFGSTVHAIGVVLSKIVPNLDVYVPARPLLLGELPGVSLAGYVARAWANAILYAAVLLAASALIFRRRDFQ